MRKALVALVVLGALGLQPVGAGAAVATGTVRGKLASSAPISGAACISSYFSCGLFAAFFDENAHPDECFNNNPDRRAAIFGTTADDPSTPANEGNPDAEAWGGQWPFLNVKDVSKYTTNIAGSTRFAKFHLDASGGSPQDGKRNLRIELRDTQCKSKGNFNLYPLAVGGTITVPIPKGTKWFVLYAVNSVTAADGLVIHRDEQWHMDFS